MTRRPHGAIPQAKGAQGPGGRPNPMASRPYFESVRAGTWWLCSHVSSQEHPMPDSRWKMGGVAGHVDGRMAVHHLQTDSIKSVEAPLYPYIRILTVEFTYTTLFL
jgi:hypothetical protein